MMPTSTSFPRHYQSAAAMSVAALRSHALAPCRSVVGCSYVSQQTLRRVTVEVGRRNFSSSPIQRNQAMDSLRGFFRQTKEKAQKAIGSQTDSQKEEEAAIAEMKPNPEKGLARLYRKRWGRPQLILNPITQLYEEKMLEHKYSTAFFRISHRKLQLLADQIGGGKPIDYSILQMQFSQKRAARRIKSTLVLARDHAVIKGLDLSKMVVAEAWVGKGRTFKKLEIKGRGRTGIRKSFQAKLSIVLREGKTWEEKNKEKLELEKKRVRRIGTGGVIRTNLPIVNTHQRTGWQW